MIRLLEQIFGCFHRHRKHHTWYGGGLEVCTDCGAGRYWNEDGTHERWESPEDTRNMMRAESDQHAADYW